MVRGAHALAHTETVRKSQVLAELGKQKHRPLCQLPLNLHPNANPSARAHLAPPLRPQGADFSHTPEPHLQQYRCAVDDDCITVSSANSVNTVDTDEAFRARAEREPALAHESMNQSSLAFLSRPAAAAARGDAVLDMGGDPMMLVGMEGGADAADVVPPPPLAHNHYRGHGSSFENGGGVGGVQGSDFGAVQRQPLDLELDSDSEGECVVCLGSIFEAVLLSCGHSCCNIWCVPRPPSRKFSPLH
jgi:hypothetical protein